MNINISDFIISLLNCTIEMIFFNVIIAALIKRKNRVNAIKIVLAICLIVFNVVIIYTIKNQIIYTVISLSTIFIITVIMSEESFIKSMYLFVISYCISIVIQFILVIPFNFLFTTPDRPVHMVIGNILTLISVFLVCKFIPIHYIYEFVLSKDLYFRLIITNTLVTALLILCLYRVKLSSAVVLLPIIAVYLVFVVTSNVVYITSKLKLKSQQNIINSYNEYLPVVEELINEVRQRQHQYKNDLASLNSLSLTCKDYDSLCAELSKNINLLSTDSTPSFLLSFNLKLMSGFLYSEYTKANNNGIHMSFNIKNYNIQTTFPEYKLTQALGILIDNAIEASIKDDTIFINIDCVDNRFIFSISNPGPTITSEFITNLFKSGYTTKKTSSQGLGLITLKKMIDENNGEIYVANEHIDNRTYLRFRIEI